MKIRKGPDKKRTVGTITGHVRCAILMSDAERGRTLVISEHVAALHGYPIGYNCTFAYLFGLCLYVIAHSCN